MARKVGVRKQEFATEIWQILDLYYCQDYSLEITAEIIYGNKKSWCKVRRRKEKFIDMLIKKLIPIWQKREPHLCLTDEVIQERRKALNQLPKEIFASLLKRAFKEVKK
ncbi:MAG: hypothetical protein DSM107014_00210 [Gomphosphaeria aponina SAG 52.96 = DSM 107014]|uniref:Uncharacterized protein n=1 Tax=Gomphosphaeria aponina SAG 52.96 = DSM 107014 TaxID=1521640 RepID=A0A941GSW8_9CHRO|nr:hypothetical protein [Gomphosphaeria aponina SAG 52.96 = DSM 107014]